MGLGLNAEGNLTSAAWPATGLAALLRMPPRLTAASSAGLLPCNKGATENCRPSLKAAACCPADCKATFSSAAAWLHTAAQDLQES